LRVAIVTGSTRPRRQSRAVAEWVLDRAAARDDARFELVDIADHGIDRFDEPLPPLAGQYSQAHTRAWARCIAAFDAFVFVTPEYNHSVPGALKTAIDFLFAEWNDKAAGFVSYGVDGGVRAVEHLRQIAGEIKLADVRTAVSLTFADDFEGYTTFTPRAGQVEAVDGLLDDVLAWGGALRELRLGMPESRAA
jgi:NAD(P)H-dependent FMN reductase